MQSGDPVHIPKYTTIFGATEGGIDGTFHSYLNPELHGENWSLVINSATGKLELFPTNAVQPKPITPGNTTTIYLVMVDMVNHLDVIAARRSRSVAEVCAISLNNNNTDPGSHYYVEPIELLD